MLFKIFSVAVFLVVGLHAVDASPKVPTQLEAIDKELDKLYEELHEARLKSMQEEIDSQPLMFEEWAKYADHMGDAENYEEKADQLKARIDQLKIKRAEIKKQSAPTSPHL